MRHLRLMVAAILCSLSSIVWATWLLLFVIYLFAVALLLFLTAPDVDIVGDAMILHNFGGLFDTMLTLFASVSGGVDWIEVMRPVEARNRPFARFFFITYLAIVLFGIMNILTAVFVRNTVHVEKVDRKLVIMEERQKMSKATAAIKKLIKYADDDDDGVITQQELESQLERQDTLLYLKRLDIDDADVRRLFMLLADGTEEVPIREFLVGLLRLRGQAKALDAASLMLETKRRGQEVRALLRYVEDRFDGLPSDAARSKRIAEYIAEEREEPVAATLTAKQRIDSLAAIGKKSGSSGLMRVETGRGSSPGGQPRLGRQGRSDVSEKSSVVIDSHSLPRSYASRNSASTGAGIG